MSTKIRVGVVGYGFSAKSFHIPFIQAVPEFRISAVLQRKEAPSDRQNAEPGTHCVVDLPHVRHHREADSFFADEEIDLVVVATHTDTHALFAEKALLASKHVIVDKPFTRSSAEADRLIKIAKDQKRVLTCFQNRRWDGDFQTMRELQRLGVLGEIMEAEIHYDFESPPWLSRMSAKEYTPGAGMAFGLGSHSIDQALQLFGRPSTVTAFLRCQRGIVSEVEDSFTIILQYEGDHRDMLVTVKTSVVTPMEKQLKYLVRGKKGSFVKWQQRSTCPQEEQIAEGIAPTDPSFGKEADHLAGTLTTYEPAHEAQKLDAATKKYVGQYPSKVGRWMGVYENLADAILGRAELEVKAEQSRDAIRVIELARMSHEKGASIAWE